MRESGASEGEEVDEVVVERVWDAPTRLLKWALAAVVATAWIYGWTMSFSTIQLHKWLGYAAGGLLLARLVWGFLGAPASRHGALFSAALRAPGYAGRLLRREPSHWPGHNPLGSLWLLGLWTALAVQVGSGLISYSDSFFDGGPFYSMVDEATRLRANAIHKICSKVVLGLVILHLCALAFYAVWKRENLAPSMLTGLKPVRRSAPKS